MAKVYLEKLSILLQTATTKRFGDVQLECKHFFSGAAVYANERICMSYTPAGFALKLPENARNKLLKVKGTKQLRYFSKGPIKKDYVVLPRLMLNNITVLRHWVKICIEYALTLPVPAKTNTRKKT